MYSVFCRGPDTKTTDSSMENSVLCSSGFRHQKVKWIVSQWLVDRCSQSVWISDWLDSYVYARRRTRRYS